MNRSKIDNLIKFSFNFHKNMGVYWYDESPDYIVEKWDKYIGVNPTIRKESPMIESYFQKWRKGDIWSVDFDKLESILSFLIAINKRAISCFHVSDLIRIFEEYIGDVDLINNKPYDNLHALIKKEVIKWLNTTENKRDYKLNLLI